MSRKNQFDIIIVGAGILGVFYAYHAVKMGLEVAIFEKDSKPNGSTVRNFGQIVPSGFNLKWQKIGIESLEIYREIMGTGDFALSQNGSIYLASNEEEIRLIEELNTINLDNGYESVLLSKSEIGKKYSGLNKDYFKAGLFFPQEFSVNPNLFIHRMIQYLFSFKNFHYFPNTLVVKTKSESKKCEVKDLFKNKYFSEKVIICSGYEFEILYPSIFKESHLELVKLQMMKIKGPKNLGLNGNILTGNTIRRYESFRECPSYKTIKSNESKNAYHNKWGIHMLFKKELDGSIIVGDSHEYAPLSKNSTLDFYARQHINDYFVEESKKILKLNHIKITDTWTGFYSQSSKEDVFCKSIDNKIHIVTGIGGKGMTAGPGFTKEDLKNIL